MVSRLAASTEKKYRGARHARLFSFSKYPRRRLFFHYIHEDILSCTAGRSRRTTIDPRIRTMPGRSTSGFHRPGRLRQGLGGRVLKQSEKHMKINVEKKNTSTCFLVSSCDHNGFNGFHPALREVGASDCLLLRGSAPGCAPI